VSLNRDDPVCITIGLLGRWLVCLCRSLLIQVGDSESKQGKYGQ
jgi:hypothetical protein